MKNLIKIDLKNQLIAMTLIVLLVIAVGTIVLTEQYSLSVFAIEGQIERTELGFENTLGLNNSPDLSWDDFAYLSTLERAYRDKNPEITPDEMTLYLENEIENLVHRSKNLFNTINSGSESEYKIFGFSLTTEEIRLVAAYPSQAVKAFNASEDAKSKGAEIYDKYDWDDHNPNAFRHGYWNALMERRISKDYTVNMGTPANPSYVTIYFDFAKMFADAHEYGKSNLGTDMDYLNNALGRTHGATYIHLNDHDMALEMAKRIANGEFYRISNSSIVATNAEDLRLQFLYNTSFVSGGVSINGVIHKISGAFEIPSQINGQSIVAISSSAFANQTAMSQITIPDSVINVGTNAFLNTSNAKIYLSGRTSAPSTFHENWNPSANPVYLNSNQCAHSSKSAVDLDYHHHKNFCNDCRTFISTTTHNFYTSGSLKICHDCGHSQPLVHVHSYNSKYEDLGNSHKLYCVCGMYIEGGHVGNPVNPGDRFVICIKCNYRIDTTKFFISIMMRGIVNPDEFGCEDSRDEHDESGTPTVVGKVYIFVDKRNYLLSD